jgi:hypothetical protein
MRTPVVYSATDIKCWSVSTQLKNGLWAPARPESWSGINIKKRITAAWMVFTGKADVLVWGEQ